jgi:hypothetical protein
MAGLAAPTASSVAAIHVLSRNPSVNFLIKLKPLTISRFYFKA